MKTMKWKNECTLCPRMCGANREKGRGFCGGGESLRAARAALHFWEEPPISGTRGSGAVFFSGCSMRCCFCQNFKISAENFGKEISTDRLAEIFLRLAGEGAHNINLVNPTHYVPLILEALHKVRHKLGVPVVYNSGGYERVETLRTLEGYIDIFMPDIKYFSEENAMRYSSAPGYFEAASSAVLEMYRQAGQYMEDKEGIMQKGLIIRHLVLPGHRMDSIAILDWLSKHFSPETIRLSLMRQYTPFYRAVEMPEINRRLTTLEYDAVLNMALSLGFLGFSQDKSSAKEEYTPLFDLTGI